MNNNTIIAALARRVHHLWCAGFYSCQKNCRLHDLKHVDHLLLVTWLCVCPWFCPTPLVFLEQSLQQN